jgi:hypothetical protein
MSRVRLAYQSHGVGCAIHHVGTTSAVNVNINEAGADVTSTGVDHFRVGADSPGSGTNVIDSAIATDDDGILEQAIGQNSDPANETGGSHRFTSST